jgi:hypothetical protein
MSGGMHCSEPENPNPDAFENAGPGSIFADPYERSASLKDLNGSTNSMLAVLRIRILVPVPFDAWIRDPGWVKKLDPDPG